MGTFRQAIFMFTVNNASLILSWSQQHAWTRIYVFPASHSAGYPPRIQNSDDYLISSRQFSSEFVGDCCIVQTGSGLNYPPLPSTYFHRSLHSLMATELTVRLPFPVSML